MPHNPPRTNSALGTLLLALVLPGTAAAAPAAPPPAADRPVTLMVEAEAFQFTGDWLTQPYEGERILMSPLKGGRYPAATAVAVPRAGRYRLWVRTIDFPGDKPGTRLCTVSVAGKRSPEKFGDGGSAKWAWEPGGEFDLKAGRTLLALERGTPFARVDAVLLTTDLAAAPPARKPAATPPAVVPLPGDAEPLRRAKIDAANGVQPAAASASVENEHVRLAFVPATRDGRATVVPRVAVNRSGAWADLPLDAAAEAYTVVNPPADAKLEYGGFYPRWRALTKPVKVDVGGVTVETLEDSGADAPWGAGAMTTFVSRSATAVSGDAIRVDFHPQPVGELSAVWQLRPGERAARLKLTFKPAAAGQYSLGYHVFQRKPLAATREILLPMMAHRHRLSARPHTLLDPFTPTPVSLVDTGAGVFGVVGEPSAIPFEWPDADKPNLGLLIRSPGGEVQPSIYQPVPGTPGARRDAGQVVEVSCRVVAHGGDWYAGYRTAADEVYGFRDYRQNVGVSLTDAALNMIDLIMDDEAGGWWDRAKAPIQIETKNGATHASPQLLLSLYRLTGDREIYRRRALPTIEFLLSRGGAHFSPLPDDTGPYPAGDMNGPTRLFGTTTFAGLWELAGRRSPALLDVALPAKTGVRKTAGYSHGGEFEEWLARYLVTGDKADLERATTLADQYLKQHVERPDRRELDPQPFFFISFVPNWEGMLRMYEVTREKRYLDAAVFGARQLMTGIWTQPLFPEQTTIHAGGQFRGDLLNAWRLDKHYKLGHPRKPGDTPERSVPGWVVSNVGIGFEQPSTYKGRGFGRMILQMGWAPNFLRLAAYTGDPTFETYARNAVVGRFANYPGYYYTGFTDLPLNPRYPYEGPDVTDFYYHHIAPHLAWTIDYLVSEAELKSGGKVRFPSQRQYGYAYFDARVYGHAPGEVYGERGAWLWLRRGLVSIDNPQLNYLTAHNGTSLFLVLTNQSRTDAAATVRFSPKELKFDPAAVRNVTVMSAGGSGAGQGKLELRDGAAAVKAGPRGLLVLRLDGVNIDVPAQRPADVVDVARGAEGARPAGIVAAPSGVAGVEARAAAVRVDPGAAWDAYCWSTASPQQARRVTFHVASPASAGGWVAHEDAEYPFELSLPVTDGRDHVRFRVTGETPAGQKFETPELLVAPSRTKSAGSPPGVGLE